MKNRFRAVELGIFATVSLVFLNSVYSLFTDGRFPGGADRKPLATSRPQPTRNVATSDKPVATVSGTENIAGFVPYETKCQTSGEVFETGAAKVRILGPFCGSPTGRGVAGEPGKTEASPLEYKIENTTSRYVATVFSDHTTGKFSTDFVPLEVGANKVVMEFRYKGGKVYPVELTIIRR